MELSSIIETILFVHGEPMALDKIAALVRRESEEVKNAIAELRERHHQGSGLTLLEHENQYQLGTNPENASYIESLLKGELTEELSRSGLEVAAIVAYKGPLTRSEIEYVRGVNSSFTLRNLLMRRLVERRENPKDTRSFIYDISIDFLKHLGLNRREELPQYEEARQQKIAALEELRGASGAIPSS